MPVTDEDPQGTGPAPVPTEQRPEHPVPFRLVVAALGWTIAVSIVAAELVYPSRVLWPIERATRGLIETTWIVSGLSLLVVLALVRAAGLGLRDVGLDRRAFRRALAPVLATWAIVQGALIVAAAARGGIDWGRPWSLGSLLAQAFGNAPEEELVFRAIVLVAVFQALRRRGVGEPGALAGALLGSTAIFVLAHAPYSIGVGLPADEVGVYAVKLAAMGLVLGALYATTGNLWLAAWIHALDNVRPEVVDVALPVKPYGVIALAGVLLLAARARRRDR